MLKSNSFTNGTFQIKPIGCLTGRTTYMAQLTKKYDNNQYLYSLEDNIKIGIHVKYAIL